MRAEGHQNCLGNFLATLRVLSKIHCLEEAPTADARSLAKTRLSLHEPLSFHIIGPAILPHRELAAQLPPHAYGARMLLPPAR